jgi:hypothetical protein
MSKDDFFELLLQTSKSELIELLHEISAADINGLDNAIHIIDVIIDLME